MELFGRKNLHSTGVDYENRSDLEFMNSADISTAEETIFNFMDRGRIQVLNHEDEPNVDDMNIVGRTVLKLDLDDSEHTREDEFMTLGIKCQSDSKLVNTPVENHREGAHMYLEVFIAFAFSYFIVIHFHCYFCEQISFRVSVGFGFANTVRDS